MLARWRQVRAYLSEAFWPRPAVTVGVVMLAAVLTGWVDRAIQLPPWLGKIIYTGGAEGARGLLSALATSSIGVAGTIFSITIAALSLASGQMGPRLLRNFTRDAGNQLALGAFLGTFAYALIVLRTVRGQDEGGFVPHLGVSGGVVLGVVCVGVLVWFVHHAAEGINVDSVIEDVTQDLSGTIGHRDPEEAPPLPDMSEAMVLRSHQSGYLQQLDGEGLAGFAQEHDCAIRLLFRPGQRVHCGIPLALVKPAVDGAEDALHSALAIGARRTMAEDTEFAADQLTEIAVRALSPGINDPNTAKTVIDFQTGVLCELAGRGLPRGYVKRDGRVVVSWPATTYAGLLDTMLHLLRQNAASSPSVIIRMLEGLTMVAQVERDAARLDELGRHADLARQAGLTGTTDSAALGTIGERYQRFRDAISGRLPSVETGR